jgi:TonB-linked SusC/RagA family outer membrane protein
MKKLTALIVTVMCLLIATAQQTSITGIVRDDKGEPIPFATVSVEGTKNATQADANGKFTLKADANAKLLISATGFAPKTVSAKEASSVVLAPSATTQLSEVVVTTALGIKRQAKEIGYATAKVTTAELTQGRAVNIQQGLAGKVSGLNITTTNSGIFENTKINLRGLRSLTGNNQPLLVIDGIPTPISYLSSLNPNDVADATVLKGASSAAIYGPDGVNGVILITTRKGTHNKPIITVSSSYQISRVAFMPKRQNRFGSGSSVDAYGQPIYDSVENYSWGPAFNGSLVPLGRRLEDGDQQMVIYSALEDEQKKFWNGNGSVFQNDVSFATDNFYISVQDAKINGLIPKDERRRTSFRFNAGRTYNKFTTSFNLNYILSNFNVVDENGLAGRFPAYNGGIYNLVLQTPPQVPLTSYKDWRNYKYAQFSNYYNDYAANPYWAIDNHRSKGRIDDLLGSFELKYDVASWLLATARVGTSISTQSAKNTRGSIDVTDYAHSHRSAVTYSDYPGSVLDQFSQNSSINGELFLNGKRNVSEFTISYLVGTQVRQTQSKNMSAQGNNLVVPDVYNLANRTGEAVSSETNFRSRLASVFGSVGVNYKGWANIEFLGRNDWDSRLNPDANSYFYPAANFSIVLSDALSLLKNNAILSYAKLRGSVSKSGNVNLGIYQLNATYSPLGGFPYGSLPGFSADNTIPDPNIKPEFVNSIEAGAEFGFWRNRINLDVTYFYQKNTDQILFVQQSVTTGYPQKLGNTADFDNYGVEMDLRLTPLVKIGQGKIDFKINATYNDNKIQRLADGINELAIGGSGNFIQLRAGAPTAINYAIVGMPAFVFKLSDYIRDPLGRVIVDAAGNPAADDSLVIRGRTLPKWIIGLNPSFSWKGLSVAMTWDYKTGHQAYHGIANDMDIYGISARSAQFNRERFVFPNSVYWDGAKYVENADHTVSSGGIPFWNSNTYNAGVATNYFTSAAAWKLRELLISYDLPNKLLGNGKVIKKAIVSFVGRNLIVILPKSNQWVDPEFNSTPTAVNPNTFGVSSSFSVPPARIFGGSLTLTF